MQSDAQPSNAGDRYHFVYTVRQMLNMLSPRNNLKLITIENVAKEDLFLQKTDETFLAVDLVEYYGGTNSSNSSLITIVQVKYSPTNPTNNWTLVKLCENKTTNGKQKAGSSVIRKLANAFDAFYSEIGESVDTKIKLKLHTNQSLKEDLLVHLSQLQSFIEKKDNKEAGKIFNQQTGELEEILNKLKNTTNLSWTKLAAFIRCWHLSAFGQAMLSKAEAELFDVGNQYYSDTDLYTDRLISFVQEHAGVNRKTSVDKKTVYDQLRLREEDFFPSPTNFQPIQNLIFSQTAQEALSVINNSAEKLLVLHGISGTGKSTTLRLIQENYGNGKFTVVYDCYADGEGLQLGSERFPFEKCFVQIINELDNLLHTGILATTNLKQSHLITQLNNSLEKAARIAFSNGSKLIIGIDAIDNAAIAAERSPLENNQSFIPMLWKLKIPENCLILISSRTENLLKLQINRSYEEFQIKGFSENESKQYLHSFWNDTNETLDLFIYKRTKGNPRVLSKLIEARKYENPTDMYLFIDQKAKETAFDYYKEELPKRLASEKDLLILGVLLEARTLLSIPLLSSILNISADEIRIIIQNLYFGLRIEEDNFISWTDQDFFDFSNEHIETIRTKVRKILADFCLGQYEAENYAKLNLSHHLFLAEQYIELIDLWLNDNRLINRILEASPHEEDVLTDIQYSVLATIKTSRFEEALRLLSIGADIKQGSDLFGIEIRKYTDIAVECGYIDRVIETLRLDSNNNIPQICFRIARSLAKYGYKEKAIDLKIRGQIIIEQESKTQSTQEFNYDVNDVFNITVTESYIYGFNYALEKLKLWNPKENLYSTFAALTKTVENEQEDLLSTINSCTLEKEQRFQCLIGLLAKENINLKETSLKSVVKEIIEGFNEKTLIEGNKVTYVYKLIQNLISKNYLKEAKSFFSYWNPPAPDHRGDDKIWMFLKKICLLEVLAIKEFSPHTFELDWLKSRRTNNLPVDNEDERLEKDIRTALKNLYPIVKGWALSFTNTKQEDILTLLDENLNTWTGNYDYWWTKNNYFIVEIACLLLEALIQLENIHFGKADQIISLTEKFYPQDKYNGYDRFAEILSRDKRYHAKAEQLIYRHRIDICPPKYKANDAVEAFLDCYQTAARIDKDLAFTIFTEARLAASEWDGNISGRAFALLKSASISQSTLKEDDTQLSKLASVFSYMKMVAFDDTNIYLEEALRLIASIQPKFAFDISIKLQQSDLVDISDSLSSIVLGLMDGNHITAQSAWGSANLIENKDKRDKVFQQAIKELRNRGESTDEALSSFAKFCRVSVWFNSRLYSIESFLDWAKQNKFDTSLPVLEMVKLKEDLIAIGITKETEYYSRSLEQQSASTLYHKFLEVIKVSPYDTLSVLLESKQDEIEHLRVEEFNDILQNLQDKLPISKFKDIFDFVEKYAAISITPNFFGQIINSFEKKIENGGDKKQLSKILEENLGRLLTPYYIHKISQEYYKGHFLNILNCEILDTNQKFKVLLESITNSLSEVDADDIYRFIGNCLEIVPPAKVPLVFDTLLERSINKMPEDTSFEIVNTDHPVKVYINFLTNLLGHPLQTNRWEALYSLSNIALNSPNETLPHIINEIGDIEHERWLTKREWNLFLLHYISIKNPILLKPFTSTFVKHLLDSDFPHAKFRYQLKEILLNINNLDPGIIPTHTLERIHKINSPISFITSESDINRSVHLPDKFLTEQSYIKFSFDEMDTLRYWYDRISTCFDISARDFSKVAYYWIVEKWGITDSLCQLDRQNNKYQYPKTSNGHGEEPTAEILRTYAERHGMFMAAGELIDSIPVVLRNDREGDCWTHWLRYRLRAADPSLNGLLIDIPPTVSENYGLFNEEYDIWRKKADESDFKKQLFSGIDQNWMVVSGYITGDFSERSFRVHIESALVSPETSEALVRSFVSAKRYNLPYTKGHYDIILPELEKDIEILGDYYITTEGGINSWFDDEDSHPLFKLHPWLIDWHQEMPFHRNDPKWRLLGRSFEIPKKEFTTELKLTRKPYELTWTNDKAECIAYHKSWRDIDNEWSEYYQGSEGRQLIVRKDAIQEFLQKTKMNMIFCVTIARNKRSNYGNRNNEKEEVYDFGDDCLYLLTGNGNLDEQGTFVRRKQNN